MPCLHKPDGIARHRKYARPPRVDMVEIYIYRFSQARGTNLPIRIQIKMQCRRVISRHRVPFLHMAGGMDDGIHSLYIRPPRVHVRDRFAGTCRSMHVGNEAL